MPPPLPPAVPVLVYAARDAVGILAPGTLVTADLYQGGVALLHCLVLRLLGEGDGAGLLKVLLADLLLAGLELGDVGVVALLRVLVGALQDGLLLQAGHGLLLVHAAQPGLGVLLARAEVHAAGHRAVLLAALPGRAVLAVVAVAAEVSCDCGEQHAQHQTLRHQLLHCPVKIGSKPWHRNFFWHY